MPSQIRFTTDLSCAPAATPVLVGCTRHSKVHAAWRASSLRGDPSGTAESRMSAVSLKTLLIIKQLGRLECAEHAKAAVECDYASRHVTPRHWSCELHRQMQNGSLNGAHCPSHAAHERIGLPCGRPRRGLHDRGRFVERERVAQRYSRYPVTGGLNQTGSSTAWDME